MGFGGLLGKSTTTYSDEEILSSSVKNQLGLDADATPSDAFALLGQSVASGARIVTGSYVGTGTYGSSNPNTLTFDFEPKAIFICGQRSSINTYLPSIGQLFNDGDSNEHVIGFTFGDDSNASTLGSYALYGHFSGNTVSWYGYNQYQQLNASNITYFYIVISCKETLL